MHRHNRGMLRAYIGPELILYGSLETITSADGIPECPDGFNITKVGSSPDDLVFADTLMHGDWTCVEA